MTSQSDNPASDWEKRFRDAANNPVIKRYNESVEPIRRTLSSLNAAIEGANTILALHRTYAPKFPSLFPNSKSEPTAAVSVPPAPYVLHVKIADWSDVDVNHDVKARALYQRAPNTDSIASRDANNAARYIVLLGHDHSRRHGDKLRIVSDGDLITDFHTVHLSHAKLLVETRQARWAGDSEPIARTPHTAVGLTTSAAPQPPPTALPVSAAPTTPKYDPPPDILSNVLPLNTRGRKPRQQIALFEQMMCDVNCRALTLDELQTLDEKHLLYRYERYGKRSPILDTRALFVRYKNMEADEASGQISLQELHDMANHILNYRYSASGRPAMTTKARDMFLKHHGVAPANSRQKR
jgi:hypothetical protein